METHPPLGMRMQLMFHPSDKEKIAYLLHKVSGGPSSNCELDFVSIPTVDLHGKQEPWQIFDKSWTLQNHFFTHIKNVGIKRHREDGVKCIGQGMWESTGPPSEIVDRRKLHIGDVQNYVYRSKINGDQDGKWILKEYTLADAFSDCVKDEYVGYMFCTVVRKSAEGKYVPDEEDAEYIKRAVSKSVEGYIDQLVRERNIPRGLFFYRFI